MRLRLTAASLVLFAATLTTVAQQQPSAAPRRHAPEQTHSVPFSLRGAGGWTTRQIQLAGSFNDWKPQEMGLTRGGDWLSFVPLRPGKYLYKFVVDGRWITDPYNLDAEVDEQGNVNSVLRVEVTPRGEVRTNRLTPEERRRLNIEDKLIDVGGGRRLHVRCAGSGPSVLLEAGHTSSSQSWFKIVPAVARFARVCVYDRAGLGGSDPTPKRPRTADDLLADLDAVVMRSGLTPGRVVLVGHSLGGVLARLYAARHPARVAGLVLVDSAHEDQETRQLAIVPEEVKAQFSEEERRIMSPEGIDFEQLFAAARAERRPTNVPLVVLTAMRMELSSDPRIAPYTRRFEEIRLELQRELVGRSTRGRQIPARRSGHFIQWDEPELVVDAIRHVAAPPRRR